MIVAVNTRFLLPGYLEGFGYFIRETFSRITRDHPADEFLFIFDRPFPADFKFPPNVTPLVLGPAARHPLLWKFWYDVQLPGLLRKHKADVLVNCDGFCSLSTNVPQCIVLHDLAFRHYPAASKKSHLLYYKRYTPRFLQKAKVVATVSHFSKNDIINAYGIDPTKIDIVFNGVRETFVPLPEEIKKSTKLTYTQGKEYFIYTGSIHPRKNLINLLKAFSVFKKRQQTSMKLVLAGRLAWNYDGFVRSLQTYKYRDDVIITGYLDEKTLTTLVGSAYAMVYVSLFEGFGVPVLEAMRAGVPVITSQHSPMQEIAGEAALYVDPSNPTDIADKMMRLYKDENLRRALVLKGVPVQATYTWERTASLLWQCIEKAVG